MKFVSTDRNLLFGMYALNNEFITQDELIKAFQFWVHDKSRPLGDILFESGWMKLESINDINRFLDQRIAESGGELNLLENMPDDLCVLHSLAETVKDEDILRASASANAYFTQTLKSDPAKSPESDAFFKIAVDVEKTIASAASDSMIKQTPVDVEKTIATAASVNVAEQNLPAEIQKTEQSSTGAVNAEIQPTLVNSGPLTPVDATVPSSPVISRTEQPAVDPSPKSVEKRIEYRTEYVFRSPVDLLGSGSFGIVYKSEDSEFKRKVALKCLKPAHLYHSLTPTSFLLEAEINGKLDHPGVLPMYGLGYTDDGVPFYVMKMLESPDLGKVIKEYHSDAVQKSDDSSDRILKFRKLIEHLKSVCLTMHYAHINGVLHCDLKPQNIMTGEHGETYVVDWGSALLIDPDENVAEKSSDQKERKHPLGEIHESRRSAFHESQGGLRNFIGGSLAYMAPEHREAHESRNVKMMTPGCDVFSLGVVFYQILTGKLPCRPMDNEDRVIQDQRMKTADYIPPRQLRPDISKVLNSICMKALSPDAKNRYASALEFATDLERWQAGEPVSAYQENLRERTVRWARRHRTTVSVIASSLGMITIFSLVLAGVLSQKNSELARKNIIIERREKMAIEAVKEFADAVSENEQLKNREELEELRKNLLKSPIKFFENLNNELRSYNDTRPESVFSLSEGIIELAHLTDAISDRVDARNSYSEAASLLQELSDQNPAIILYRSRLASALTSLGLAEAALGNNSAAGLNHRKSIKEFDKLISDNPNESGYQNGLAGVYNSLGNLERDMGNQAEARNYYQKSIALRESLVEMNPGNFEMQNALTRSLTNLSYIDINQGKVKEARESYKKAIEMCKAIVKAQPEVIQYRDDLALAIINTVARDLEKSEPALAREQMKDAILNFRSILEKNPTMTKFQMRLAKALIQQGLVELKLGDIPGSRTSFSESSVILEELVKGNPNSIEFLAGLAFSLNNIGQLEMATNSQAHARVFYERAIEKYETLLKLNPESNEFKENLASVLTNLGETLKSDLAASVSVFTRAIKLREEILAKPPVMPDTLSDLAGTYDNLARVTPEPVKKRELIEKAIALQSKAIDIHPDNNDYLHNMSTHMSGLIDILSSLKQLSAFDETRTQFNSLSLKYPQNQQIVMLKIRLELEFASFLVASPDRTADEYKKAEQIAKSLYELNSNTGLIARVYGAAKYRMSQYMEAKNVLEKSLQLNKADASGVEQSTDLAFLAMTNWKLNQKAEAESLMKRIDLIMPNLQLILNKDLIEEAKSMIRYEK